MELKSCSPISSQQKQKIAFLNQKSSTIKIRKIFNNQNLINYLFSTNNIVEYKNNYQYFYAHFSFITHGFFIDELKNTFNVILLQFLKNNKKYNQKTTYRTFKDKYDWVIDCLIKKIYTNKQL